MCARIGTKIINALLVLLLNASLGSVLSAQTVDDRPLSPRLAALQDQLKSGNRTALDNFWKEISERGAPIVEEVPGNDRDVLVTIVWQAREETRNVFVFRVGDVNKPMVRLLDTDLWYKTFQLQKGARFISWNVLYHKSVSSSRTIGLLTSPTRKTKTFLVSSLACQTIVTSTSRSLPGTSSTIGAPRSLISFQKLLSASRSPDLSRS